ncbi:short-chain dehydrogenase/reductase SDR [Catenulispora acidiphila DSM 44928]|uniref:Short-chain dehydrogenase/reductase SDR n=1 Tax=Catenulispora acidiphila (strain DSM 44928 / JCM 14897 / NBRC 102108 / NRRL B-24433 / ID139908) TaxID=479433 RepID=C7Q251_CATAD|nr:SDR family oxidoreductase [Catenulispora acidiphila]ACU77588.1 short-chain dehydrogenase/reductase SDR [Catenulispora acidiphila DSM 44928]
MLLEGKTVIVSGVGEGLGREVAQAAYDQGANVVLGARTEAKLAKAAAEFDSARVAHATTDITSDDDCRRLVALAVERFGGLDGLVNVAAMDQVFGGVSDADFADWRAVYEVNVVGTLQLSKAAIPHLARESGATTGIVHILSQSMWVPATEVMQAAYAASKGALLSATYGMAKELGPRRIRVNAVVPSWMWGPMVQGYVAWTASSQGIAEEQVLSSLTDRMALPEMASDGDVANAAVFMVSPYAGGITGQSLAVNAGDYLR